MATRTVSSSRFLAYPTEKALSFNGTSDYMTSSFAPSSSGFSIGFWIYRISYPGGTIKYFDCSSPNDRNGSQIQSDNGNNFYITYNNASAVSFGPTISKLEYRIWNHIVFTFDGSTAKGYLNSILFSTTPGKSMTGSNGTLTIGRRSSSSVEFANMMMKDFVIQNTTTPWTQAQINALYYQRQIPTGANVWYKFDNNVNDSTGNGNTGTLTGGSYTTNVPSQFTSRSTAGSRFLVRNFGKCLFSKGSFGNPRLKPTDDTVNTIGTTSSYSYSAFVYLLPKTVSGAAPGNDNHCLVCLDFDFATNKGYAIEVTNAGTFQTFYGNTSATGIAGKVPFGRWIHIGFTISGTTQLCYINGAQVDSLTIGRVADAGLTRRMFNAEDSSSTNRAIYTYIDEIFVMNNTVITAAQMSDICFKGIYPSKPSVYYKCDDASGNVTDYSGNNNTGLVQDNTWLKVNNSNVFMVPRSLT